MKRAWLYMVAAGAALILWATEGRGQDHQHHHPFHMDFYRHWKNPVSGVSCCNARIEGPDGIETGDCEPTKAEVRNGSWWVWIRQIGQWQEVPDVRIIRERNPNIFDAHLCWTPLQGIMCFSPPDTGG